MRNKIDIDEIVKLKEQGMTDKAIAEYLKAKGIEISDVTIGNRLIKYYNSQGKKKPRAERKNRKQIEIDIDELVKLKEQGMSDQEITDYLEKQGIKISRNTVRVKLVEYYNLLGKKKPETRKQIEVNIEEIVALKEEGRTDQEITDFLNKKGIVISKTSVTRKLLEYYCLIGKKKPKIKNKINISIEEIVKLREQGMTYKKIADYLKQQGIEVSSSTIQYRLMEYYKDSKDKKTTLPQNKAKIIRLYENDIKEILMSGMSIEEFISEFEQEENEEKIRKNLKKLRVVAEYSEKENSEFKADISFIEVIDILENPKESQEKYQNLMKIYISNGICGKGKIDLIKDGVFSGNTDLMIYMLKRLKVNLYKGYDVRVFEKHKKQYEEKIDTYLKRIEIVDSKRKQKNKLSDNKDER